MNRSNLPRLGGRLLIVGAFLLELLVVTGYAFALPNFPALVSSSKPSSHAKNAHVRRTSTGIAYPQRDRYFPAGTSVDVMKAKAAQMTKRQVKLLIEQEVRDHWSIIHTQLGFTTINKAYAFFLGLATRESTLDAGLETGSGAGHSYGAIQAAEPAYANANPNYTPENDVPKMYMYQFSPENFYDPRIAIHMGIRHLLHFANQAKAANYQGTEMLRHALIGYNTGLVQTNDQNAIHSYADEIAAMAGWYLRNGHLQDNTFTWTGDAHVDRSNPWGWY